MALAQKQSAMNRGLIRYPVRHYHATPLEMVELKFHVRVPMDCWRQRIRNRMASVNEYLTQYPKAIDSAPKACGDRLQLTSHAA